MPNCVTEERTESNDDGRGRKMLINLKHATKVFCERTDHEIRALDQVDLDVNEGGR